MLVELAGAKFPTYYFHYSMFPKKKIVKYTEKSFGNIFLKLAELKMFYLKL